MSAQTLYDKLWQSHVVHTEQDGTALLYIDRHLLHEVTSPQAFEGLRLAGRKPWRLSANLAVADHNVPTTDRSQGIADPISRLQVETLDNNCADFGITEFKMGDVRQGIVHVIGPEQGATLPGMTVVCGDSHTSTHGAFGALAHGIGTSEVEHVLATQCLLQKKSKTLLVRVEGALGKGATAKEVRERRVYQCSILLPHPSPASPNNSSRSREMHAEVVCDLLVRITSCRVCRDDGGISVWRTFRDFCQWRRLGAALGKGDLHIILACLDMRLHSSSYPHVR